MPAITSTVPAPTQAVKGSPKISTPIKMVDIGPTMPACAAMLAPMRSIAIITISTGATVHSVALSNDSQITSGATACAALSGRSSTNCRMHSTQATVLTSPTSRNAPRRLTISPL